MACGLASNCNLGSEKKIIQEMATEMYSRENERKQLQENGLYRDRRSVLLPNRNISKDLGEFSETF